MVEQATVAKTKVRHELAILPSGSKMLHTKCKAVKEITPAVKAFARVLEIYLVEHWHDSPHPVAISAPQLGKSVRMFSYVTNAAMDEIEIHTVVNPELVYEKKLRFVTETCLSIPGRSFKLKRGKIVKIRAGLLNGLTRTFKSHDIIAQMFLHELDHLNGITIDTIGQLIA